MEDNTITSNEPVVEPAAAEAVAAVDDVKVEQADEPMNAAPKNLISLTVKTPKEKETVSISAEANVKEVSFYFTFFIFINSIHFNDSLTHSSRTKWAKHFPNPTTNCV